MSRQSTLASGAERALRSIRFGSGAAVDLCLGMPSGRAIHVGDGFLCHRANPEQQETEGDQTFMVVPPAITPRFGGTIAKRSASPGTTFVGRPNPRSQCCSHQLQTDKDKDANEAENMVCTDRPCKGTLLERRI